MKSYLYAPGTGLSLRRTRKSILVVEDNDDQWFLIRWALLRTQPDSTFIRTSNTLETLSYLSACKFDKRPLPDLILLDLYLPAREDGWELLESIKLHHTFRRLPVVILSNSSAPEDIEQSYYLRSSAYLVKPTTYPEWLACFEVFRKYWMDAVTLPKSEKNSK